MRLARINGISNGDRSAIVATILIALIFMIGCRDSRAVETGSWELDGPLLARDSNIWIVDTIPIVVPEDIAGSRTPDLGDYVSARGLIDASGRRVAEDVEVVAGTAPASTLPAVTLSGEIEQIDADLWMIDGHQVLVADGTHVRSNGSEPVAATAIVPGDFVVVAGYELHDGRIVATEIDPHNQLEQSAQAETDQPAAASTDTQPSQPETPTADNSTADTSSEAGDDAQADSSEDQTNESDNDDNAKKDKPPKPDKPDKKDGRDKKDKPGKNEKH